MAVFWVAAPCSLVEVYLALMMEAARTSETLVNGATTQKTAIFVNETYSAFSTRLF
jgi:hypothetical protein